MPRGGCSALHGVNHNLKKKQSLKHILLLIVAFLNQIDGVAMGFSLVPVLTNLFMGFMNKIG